ncbi:unnamed protein product [Peronospora destructor]|nr:unnamed protein product [Peronospora destructor]
MMREEDPRAQLYGPRSSGRHQQSPQVVEDHHADMDRVLVAQDDVDAAVNRAADAQQEAEEAEERAARAEKTAAEIRQSNRELFERMRMLERQFLGQPQTGTQPHEMSAGRRARREGRSTYAPLTQPAEHPRES